MRPPGGRKRVAGVIPYAQNVPRRIKGLPGGKMAIKMAIC